MTDIIRITTINGEEVSRVHFIAIIKGRDKDAEREEVRRRFLDKLMEQIAEQLEAQVEVEYDSTNGYINIYKCRLNACGTENVPGKEEGQQ